VTKTADTNDGTGDPDCSLREAIEAANTNPGADDVR
jgi:CSLREA domain-containing protein